MEVVPKFKWGDFEEEESEQQQQEHEEEDDKNSELAAAAAGDKISSGGFKENVPPIDQKGGGGGGGGGVNNLGGSSPDTRVASGNIVMRSSNSKERFRQRLWCYLFENLNRAIDELYFMCELECDMEQIQEALVVFDEAGLDFCELKARVEGFHKLSKAAARSGPGNDHDDTSSTKQLERQRPHAIAWEVRRMASSPRRADILSLSLDTFKRVQLESGKPEQAKRRDTVRFLSFETAECAENIPPATPPTLNEVAHSRRCADSDSPSSTAAGSEPQASSVQTAQTATDQCSSSDNKKKKRDASLEAWKEKRNWEDILSSPARTSRSPVVGRKSTERGRVLHDKLMSPERKKKSPMEMKKEVDEKQARATRIRMELDNERALRLQRTTEKLNRVSEWQAVRSNKLREGMHARQQRGESRHEAHLAQIARRASDESSKVSEVRFITSLNEENKKLSLQQKLQGSEVRRAERLQNLRIKQKEDMAREEAALERRKLLEAERLQRIADTQRKKEEAQARREEERKAATAAREARAVEQVRKKEVRAKAQEQEVELLRHKLAERLRESSLRRKVYLEQIRERAVMEPIREQGSPLSKRPSSRDGRVNDIEIASDRDLTSAGKLVTPAPTSAEQPDVGHQATVKKRIKKIRQRLTTRKFELPELAIATEGVSQATKSRMTRWMQDLQRCQQARKAGTSAMASITGEIIKVMDGKEVELHVARQAGLLDFIASTLPVSHTSKQQGCQSTVALLKLLLILLNQPANRAYFLARNLLPPLIPVLSSALENYSTMGCSNSASVPGHGDEKLNAVGELLEDLVKCVTLIMAYTPSDERLLQMQDDLVELIVACDIVHRLRNLFALFDRPQIEGAPFPPPVLLGLKLLETLTSAYDGKSVPDAETHWSERLKPLENCEQPFINNSEPGTAEAENQSSVEPSVPSKDDLKKHIYSSKSGSSLLASVAKSRLVGLPSLLTAVLLQANPRLSPDQAAASLPSNFEQVATSVLRVLNNTASLDLSLVQTMLAMPDLKMEFFHLASFLLSYCTCKWRVASDQVASLLLETLLLLGYFSLLHSGNQAVLRWGKSPTILHKICDLPFAFFSDPELMPVLVGTLLAACYGCERNRDVIQQELSMEMLLSVVRSSKEKHRAKHMEEDGTRQAKDRAVETPCPGSTTKRKLKSEPGEDRQHAVFLLENRFPLRLWDNALEFFSLRTFE